MTADRLEAGVEFVTGRDALMRQLLADGTRYVFGNPGTTEIGFLDGLHDYPQLELVLALHEGVAVSAADGYARATRRPAFVQLHTAPGLGNGLGMLHNAAQARTPLIVYAGNASSREAADEPILWGDLVEMARPVCKWAVQVEHPDDIAKVLRRVTKVAAEPPAGPVLLSIPMNVLAESGRAQVQPTSHGRTAVVPAAAELDRLASALLSARRVAVVIGDGLIGRGGSTAVTDLAELLGAPIFAGGWASEPVLAPGHPLWAGAFNTGLTEAAKAAFLGADAVLYLGAPAQPPSFDTRPVPAPGVRLLQIGLVPGDLAKTVPVELAVAADPAATAEVLAERVRSRIEEPVLIANRAEADRLAAQLRDSEAEYWARLSAGFDAVPISGARLATALGEALPADAVVFDESLSVRPFTARRLARQPGSYFRAPGSGIGSGLPGAIGVQLAKPDRPVVGLVADGCAMYATPALWTAAHHRIPVTWVICNNRSYRTLKSNGLAHLSPQAAANIPGTDLGDPPIAFHQLAESMGVPGRLVEHPGQLSDALAEAVRRPGPALVEVIIDGAFP
ncbi:thiamine pyrophosphate-binding protein [Amycolatopsis thermoflava]|uniref:Benzoylformate decarboxylase n=1 Tax=Amycolatopsis thermoflava TaxID=84480 RepID=A0A3N2GP89_9PSEU|nr:thiamine pyrophosphate-binding protein [Amycolatopsis thermoflava]ROS38438.1 benzoylformate decarboxylase [Amycolatopsis thermoflava]